MTAGVSKLWSRMWKCGTGNFMTSHYWIVARLISPPFAVASTCRFRHGLAAARIGTVCKKRYLGTQADMCSFCGKRIKLDMSRHVANYHLELAQLWCCPVSWCTIWKGTPQDCMDHLCLAHTVPASVKTANLGKWFPPWTVKRQMWCDALNPRISGVSTDVLLFSGCGAPLIHHCQVFAKGILHISLRGSYITKPRTFITQ